VAVTDKDELSLVGRAYKIKYQLDSKQDFPEAIIFRLDQR